MSINDIERKRKLAGEIGKAICNLANIAEDNNDSQYESDERGRGNGAVGVIVFEDGSGYIVNVQQSPDSNPLGNSQIVYEFKSPEEVVEILFDIVSERSE